MTESDSEKPEAADDDWGNSIVASPWYIAEQQRRNAEAYNAVRQMACWNGNMRNMAPPGDWTMQEPLWKRALRKLLF